MTKTLITRVNQPAISTQSDIALHDLIEASKRGGFNELDCYQSDTHGGMVWQGWRWDAVSKSDILVTHMEMKEVQ